MPQDQDTLAELERLLAYDSRLYLERPFKTRVPRNWKKQALYVDGPALRDHIWMLRGRFLDVAAGEYPDLLGGLGVDVLPLWNRIAPRDPHHMRDHFPSRLSRRKSDPAVDAAWRALETHLDHLRLDYEWIEHFCIDRMVQWKAEAFTREDADVGLPGFYSRPGWGENLTSPELAPARQQGQVWLGGDLPTGGPPEAPTYETGAWDPRAETEAMYRRRIEGHIAARKVWATIAKLVPVLDGLTRNPDGAWVTTEALRKRLVTVARRVVSHERLDADRKTELRESTSLANLMGLRLPPRGRPRKGAQKKRRS